MVKRILQNESEIKQVLVEDRKTSHLVPKWQDIQVLEAINAALEPLAELTDIMSGSRYVTVSSLKAMLQRLEDLLSPNDEDGRSDNIDVKLRRNVLQDLLPRYEEPEREMLLNVTSFLDPRFKVIA